MVHVQSMRILKLNANAHQDSQAKPVKLVNKEYDNSIEDGTKIYNTSNMNIFRVKTLYNFLEIECDPSCMNGGVCDVDHNGNLVCFCPPGYSGIQCEHSMFWFF